MALGKPHFPENLITQHFSTKKLSVLYNPRRVDDITFGDEALLKIGSNEKEQRALWRYWATTILHHPIIYFKHRTSILLHGLICIPAQKEVTNFYNKLSEDKTPKGRILSLLAKIFGVIFLSHLFVAMLCLGYLILAIATFTRSWAAKPLLFFNATGLLMLVILFFFSMAGRPRYTYITACMVHASHIFAFICFKAMQTNMFRISRISQEAHYE